jgi:hypothetical protein
MYPPGSTPKHAEASLGSKEFNPKSQTEANDFIQDRATEWEVLLKICRLLQGRRGKESCLDLSDLSVDN